MEKIKKFRKIFNSVQNRFVDLNICYHLISELYKNL